MPAWLAPGASLPIGVPGAAQANVAREGANPGVGTPRHPAGQIFGPAQAAAFGLESTV